MPTLHPIERDQGVPVIQLPLDDVLRFIDDVIEQYQREEDQGILQERLDRAREALAGKHACERLKRSMTMRYGMRENIATMTEKRKRA
jgi:hypothetical protein